VRCEVVVAADELQIIVCRQCHPECEWCWPYCGYDLDDQMQQDERAWHLQHDLTTEDELARAFVYGESDVPWPWYADAPCEVQEPEVFGP
jgi:hypothetical protein